jgi:hypothetical protein
VKRTRFETIQSNNFHQVQIKNYSERQQERQKRTPVASDHTTHTWQPSIIIHDYSIRRTIIWQRDQDLNCQGLLHHALLLGAEQLKTRQATQHDSRTFSSGLKYRIIVLCFVARKRKTVPFIDSSARRRESSLSAHS